jgi:hypothetical protein
MLVNGHLRAQKYLSADSIIEGLRSRFEATPDVRRASSVKHSQADCLMAAFAMFSLKEPSLLAFDQRRQDQSLMNLYRIQSIPSDTQHHEILDQVDPKLLNECFADICPHCLVKNRKSCKTEYSHQMVAAVLVHPSKDVVIPIAVEAIIQQDRIHSR